MPQRGSANDTVKLAIYATQVDMDGKSYVLDHRGLIGPDDLRSFEDLGIYPATDDPDDGELWLAGEVRFQEIVDLAGRRLALLETARQQRQEADRQEALAQRVAALLRAPPVAAGPTGPEPAAQPDPQPERWVSTTTAAGILGVHRSTLDEMRERAPRTLPGAPTHVGQGKERRSWRWDSERLQDWLDAYTAWLSTRGRRR